MDDIIMGCARSDYQMHSKHFSVALKAQVGSETFLETSDQYRKKWGVPGEREVMCIFRKEKSFTVVWQQNFDRSQEQVAAVATVALKGGRYFIDQFSLI